MSADLHVLTDEELATRRKEHERAKRKAIGWVSKRFEQERLDELDAEQRRREREKP